MLADDLDCAQPPRPAPRYLRFVTALVLGTAAATAAAACGGEDDPPGPIDAAVDAWIDVDAMPVVDAGDARIDSGVVDGPLPPPDLPRAVA